MLNELHSLIFRPERGWDPVDEAGARAYAEFEYRYPCDPTMAVLEREFGPLQSKSVLDLGGGPGHFSAAMASRGAKVVWHDVSAAHLALATDHCRKQNQNVEFSLGYLEHAPRMLHRDFDLVFCRGCWCYCMTDARFAEMIYRMIRPGGGAYIWTNTPVFDTNPGYRRIYYFLNGSLNFKVGHPHPPHGRAARLFERYADVRVTTDYSVAETDVVFVHRSGLDEGTRT